VNNDSGRGDPNSTPTGTAEATEQGVSCSKSGAKIQIGNVRSEDGAPGIGPIVLLDVSVSTPAAPNRTYWLIADFTVRDRLYAARMQITGSAKGLRIKINTSSVPSQRTFYVVEANEEATPILREDYAHDMEPRWDVNRTKLPDGVIGTISNKCKVTRTR
jgi:hypothetical protein